MNLCSCIEFGVWQARARVHMYHFNAEPYIGLPMVAQSQTGQAADFIAGECPSVIFRTSDLL